MFSYFSQATEIPGNTSSTTTVFITIEDINDNKPTFPTTGFPYTASIPEDTPKGTPIFFQMGAFDKDREVRGGGGNNLDNQFAQESNQRFKLIQQLQG